MRRALVLILAATVLMAAKPIWAQGGPDGLVLIEDRPSISCNVEQQTFIVYGSFDIGAPCPGDRVVNNPTACPWDIDDYTAFRGEGRMDRDEVIAATMCVVYDATHIAKPVQAQVSAGHDRLVVRLDSTDGRSWVVSPVREPSGWVWRICADDASLVQVGTIAGSNGGNGTIVDYTLRIEAARNGAVNALLKFGRGLWSVACP